MKTSDTSDSLDVNSGIDALMEAGRRLLALALEQGAEQAEVYGMVGRSVDVELRRDKIELASESFHSGLGLRAVVAGAVGFSSTSDLSLLQFVARSAVQSARARGRDDFWRSLPVPERVEEPQGIFDHRIAEIEPEQCLEYGRALLSGCMAVKGAEPVSGGVTAVLASDFVINSLGVELAEASTLMNASMEAIARGDGVATGSEFFNSRSLPPSIDEALAEAGERAAEMAVSSLGGTKAESGTADVLLRPLAVAEILEYTLLPALSADNVQKGRSSLRGRAGEVIAAPHLSVVDDGLLPGGIDSTAFDGEGVPSQRTLLIDDGALLGFVYDTYTAGKESQPARSTGNAVRSGYTDVPRVGNRNLIVSSKSAYELDAETKGFLVSGLIGAHTANPISGDFSVEARNAFLIEPGREARPVRSLMLAGNIFQLIREIEIGRDVRAVGSVVTPTVGLRMKVVGS